MRSFAIFAILAGLTVGPVAAQSMGGSGNMAASPPASMEKMFPSGSGTERGMSSVNNSGQVGTTTVHRVGPNNSDVSVNLKSTPPGRAQLAMVVRSPGGSCNEPPLKPVAFTLRPVVDGASRSQIAISEERLMSGNFFVVVTSKDKPDHVLSCGYLFHR